MAAIEMKVPSPGESISEVQIARWLKKDGDWVEKDEEICEIDSDKATLTLSAEADGVLKINVKEGETIAVGTVVCTIDTEAKGAAKPAKKEPEAAQQQNVEKENVPAKETKAEAGGAKIYSEGIPSVSAKKMMEEKGVSAKDVKGTGRGGRITKGDVIEASAKTAEEDGAKAPEPATQTTSENGQQRRGEREQRREKMTMLRKKVSQRLVAVKNETAMLTTFNEVDMSRIMQVRKKFKDKFKEKHGIGLGFMSFFTKAVCQALQQFPVVNGQIDGEEIIYHNYADVGIAVSTPKGLMVPVIRDADKMTFAEIEKAIEQLAGKARDGKISIDEMSGGTFTITNGGVFGSLLSTPILNPPQSAILGMHNIVERPVAINGKVEIRPMMYVALSYDHRIIDGKESVSFLVAVKQMLEEPNLLLYGSGDPEKKLLGL